jgi:hypothetical protein
MSEITNKSPAQASRPLPPPPPPPPSSSASTASVELLVVVLEKGQKHLGDIYRDLVPKKLTRERVNARENFNIMEGQRLTAAAVVMGVEAGKTLSMNNNLGEPGLAEKAVRELMPALEALCAKGGPLGVFDRKIAHDVDNPILEKVLGGSFDQCQPWWFLLQSNKGAKVVAATETEEARVEVSFVTVEYFWTLGSETLNVARNRYTAIFNCFVLPGGKLRSGETTPYAALEKTRRRVYNEDKMATAKAKGAEQAEVGDLEPPADYYVRGILFFMMMGEPSKLPPFNDALSASMAGTAAERDAAAEGRQAQRNGDKKRAAAEKSSSALNAAAAALQASAKVISAANTSHVLVREKEVDIIALQGSLDACKDRASRLYSILSDGMLMAAMMSEQKEKLLRELIECTDEQKAISEQLRMKSSSSVLATARVLSSSTASVVSQDSLTVELVAAAVDQEEGEYSSEREHASPPLTRTSTTTPPTTTPPDSSQAETKRARQSLDEKREKRNEYMRKRRAHLKETSSKSSEVRASATSPDDKEKDEEDA